MVRHKYAGYSDKIAAALPELAAILGSIFEELELRYGPSRPDSTNLKARLFLPDPSCLLQPRIPLG